MILWLPGVWKFLFYSVDGCIVLWGMGIGLGFCGSGFILVMMAKIK